jgi:hypothetical protein
MPRFKPTPEKPLPGKPGRPSTYSQEIAERIIELMAEGHDMQEICNMPDMPSRSSVLRWRHKHPEFDAQCARAREALADFEMFKMKEIVTKCTEKNVNSTRAKLNHLQWRVMKIAPRIYGDRTQTEITGAGGGPVQVQALTIDARDLMPEHREALKQALLAAKKAKDAQNE